MDIVILPASGSRYPYQIAIICALCDNNYEAKTIMGTSGGNLVAYLTAYSEWDKKTVLSTCREISSKLYCCSWVDPQFKIFPSISLGFFKGAAYNHNDSEICHFFNKLFDHSNITKYDIWTGVYNQDCKKAQLFCNQYSDRTELKYRNNYPHELCLPPIYLNGDIKNITKVCVASASIPTIVPRKKILGQYYIDGGIAHSSPGSMIKRTMKPIKSFHIIYINFTNLNKDRKMAKNGNILSTGMNAVNEMSYRMNIEDRNNIINLLGDKYYFKDFELVSIQQISTILHNAKKSIKSVIEFYPKNTKKISITNHSSNDSLNIIKKCNDNICCRIWWTE